MTGLAGKRILIVEDEALIAMMLGEALAERGGDVVGPANTLAAGLRLAESEALDAAVIDVNLNGESADPVAVALDQRGIPFVVTSGYGQSPEMQRFNAAVFDKPYSPDSIVDALIRLTGARQ